MVLAFSLQSDIKSIGAYAGFAAIIGLALLVLLYFAQAREIRRMSDWLHEHEDRLANLPARSGPTPRPVPTPGGRVVPVPQPPAAQEAGAAPTATVAVPGARRVAVGAVAAAGTGLTAAADEPPVATAPGAVAAATVAGAMGAAPAAMPAAGVGDRGDAAELGAAGLESVPAAGEVDAVARESVPAGDDGAAGSPSGLPPPADGSQTAGGEGSVASAAVPLSARPAATAEPLGAAAQGVDPEAGAGDLAPDTAENAIVTAFEPGAIATFAPEAGVLDRSAGEPAVVVPFESHDDVAPPPGPAASEISAERIEVSPFDFSSPASEPPLAADTPPAGVANDDELGALAPSTPAGARPRFPPGPDARATPVGAGPVAAAARAGAVDAGDDEEAAPATTQRRRRDLPPPGDGDNDALGHRGGGSTLRLLAAAVVIVVVLIFIAARVFGSGKTATGPSPSTITVAVLNGTHVSALASAVSGTLTRIGFKQGAVANALSRGHHVTLVGYTTGNRADALLVAKALGATPVRVGPVDPHTAALAEATTTTTPNVVVTLGSDYQPQ